MEKESEFENKQSCVGYVSKKIIYDPDARCCHFNIGIPREENPKVEDWLPFVFWGDSAEAFATQVKPGYIVRISGPTHNNRGRDGNFYYSIQAKECEILKTITSRTEKFQKSPN